MKKIFTLLTLSLGFSSYAQTSIEVTDMATLFNVPANGTVNLVTSASANTNRTYDVKNTSASTQTYIVIRYDQSLNTGADAYYCFAGTCYGPTTFVSPNALVLAPGGSASQSTVAYTTLTTDLDEGPTAGPSIVKYTVKNQNTPSDSLQFILYYNNPSAGLISNKNSVVSINVFPNPAKNVLNANVNINEAANADIKVQDINGKTVYSSTQLLSVGKNNIKVNIAGLEEGQYFLSIQTAQGISKEKVLIIK